jgi:hypothetical protein
LIWQKSIGGSLDDYFSSIIETRDGHYIVSGFSSSSDGDLSSNNGGYDGILAKFDYDGSIEWVKNYGGNGNDAFNEVIEDNSGNFIVTGLSGSNDGYLPTNYGGDDGIITKIDSSGTQIWIKNYGSSGGNQLYSIIQCKDGNYITAGTSTIADNNVNKAFGGYDWIIIKVKPNGDKIWVRTYGGSQNDYLQSIIQLNDNGYAAVGYTNSDNSGDIPDSPYGAVAKGLIMKFNLKGELVN